MKYKANKIIAFIKVDESILPCLQASGFSLSPSPMKNVRLPPLQACDSWRYVATHTHISNWARRTIFTSLITPSSPLGYLASPSSFRFTISHDTGFVRKGGGVERCDLSPGESREPAKTSRQAVDRTKSRLSHIHGKTQLAG